MSRVLGKETVIRTLTVVFLLRFSKTFLFAHQFSVSIQPIRLTSLNLAAPFEKTVLKIVGELLSVRNVFNSKGKGMLVGYARVFHFCHPINNFPKAELTR